jgi:hypothetical protein
MRNERERRDANRRTWRLIAATGLFSLMLTLATGWALRATAQQPAAPPATAPASPAAPAADEEAGPEGDALPDEGGRRSPAPPAPEEPPDLRESADNNLSFPVDI